MKRLRFVVVLIGMATAIASGVWQIDLETLAEGAANVPCAVPEGTALPVDFTSSTPSTEPRMYPAGLKVGWADRDDWNPGGPDSNLTILSGLWGLPPTGALTIEDGVAAIVTVTRGDPLVLLVCGGNGVIDTSEEDGQTTDVAEGTSLTFVELDRYFVDLQAGGATFWFFGAGSESDTRIAIDIFGENGVAQVCSLSTCWTWPELPPRMSREDCEGLCLSGVTGGGCAGIKCWVP